MNVNLIKFKTAREATACAARNCYSSIPLLESDVIAWSGKFTNTDNLIIDLFDSGHNTTLEHFVFNFHIEGLSRHFIWKYLHGLHDFYASDQQSQRYAKISPNSFFVPQSLEQEDKEKWKEHYDYIYKKYLDLIEKYEQLYIDKNLLNKQTFKLKRKKAMEMSRYILPLGQKSFLVHSLNFMGLLRMIGFLSNIKENEECYEEAQELSNIFQEKLINYGNNSEIKMKIKKEYLEELLNSFNEDNYKFKFLKNYSNNYEQTMKKLIELAKNKYNNDNYNSNNNYHYDKINSILEKTNNKVLIDNVSIKNSKFYKLEENPTNFEVLYKNQTMSMKFDTLGFISHSADSQNQRHRTTLKIRPNIKDYFDNLKEKYYIPKFLELDKELKKEYIDIMNKTYSFFEEQANKYGFEKCIYLLPNSQKVFIHDIDNLFYYSHKAQKRLCYNSQEEIFDMTVQQVEQLKEEGLDTDKFNLNAPCVVNFKYGTRPYCTEGVRFCGVKVWKLNKDVQYIRTI